jgi:C-terminal processing protease CtpA/Prc
LDHHFFQEKFDLKMRLPVVIFFVFSGLAVQAQSRPVMQPVAMKEDLAFLRHYLESTHPMYYIHHTRQEMNAFMDSLSGTLDKPLPFLEFYKKIALVIAAVGCEHTYCNYGDGFDKLIKSAVFLPYQLYFINNKVHVLVNLTSEKDILPGDELITINNYPIDSIRRVLHSLIPVDGDMEGPRDTRLSSMSFNIWYYLFVEQAKQFTLSFRNRQGSLVTKTVKGVKLKDMNQQAVRNPVNKQVFELDARLKELRKEPLRIELLPGKKAALLTVQTFSMEMDRFRKQIDSLFQLAAKNSIETLILDLRYNGGGEVELAADLLNYFITAPTSIVEYSYIITDRDEDFKLANIPDEMRKDKYKFIEPLKDGKSYVKLTPYSGELKMLQPRTDRFTGKVYILANGGTSSAASTFTGVMKSLGLATIVGEETVGGYLGGGTVIGLDLTLPNSKITAHSGLVYQRFRTSGEELHRGVTPDVPYVMSFEDMFSQERPWLKFVMDLR